MLKQPKRKFAAAAAATADTTVASTPATQPNPEPAHRDKRAKRDKTAKPGNGAARIADTKVDVDVASETANSFQKTLQALTTPSANAAEPASAAAAFASKQPKLRPARSANVSGINRAKSGADNGSAAADAGALDQKTAPQSQHAAATIGDIAAQQRRRLELRAANRFLRQIAIGRVPQANEAQSLLEAANLSCEVERLEPVTPGAVLLSPASNDPNELRAENAYYQKQNRAIQREIFEIAAPLRDARRALNAEGLYDIPFVPPEDFKLSAATVVPNQDRRRQSYLADAEARAQYGWLAKPKNFAVSAAAANSAAAADTSAHTAAAGSAPTLQTKS